MSGDPKESKELKMSTRSSEITGYTFFGSLVGIGSSIHVFGFDAFHV